MSTHLLENPFHADTQVKYPRRYFAVESKCKMPDSSPNGVPSLTEPYTGVPSTQIRPVFGMARKHRFGRVDADSIIAMTGTSLDPDIVSAILEGALRLLPPDNSIEGQERRRQEMAHKAAHALRAESAFVDQVRRLQPSLQDESQQKQRIKAALEDGRSDVVRSTPDIFFDNATNLCGRSCRWVEYKNTFGFKSNPFLHQKHKKQLRRYVATFGPGMVVYKLGFEHGLFQMDELSCFREQEVTQWIDQVVVGEE